MPPRAVRPHTRALPPPPLPATTTAIGRARGGAAAATSKVAAAPAACSTSAAAACRCVRRWRAGRTGRASRSDEVGRGRWEVEVGLLRRSVLRNWRSDRSHVVGGGPGP
eukprot:365052-Chlamydomonas_euryale.AAC.25